MEIDKSILMRFSSGECSEEEKALVESWFNQFEAYKVPDERKLAALELSLDRRVLGETNKSIFKWVAAAAAIIIAGFSIYFFKEGNGNWESAHPVVKLDDIKAPISSGVLLKVGNEKLINLDTLKIGAALVSDGYEIRKNAEDEIFYKEIDGYGAHANHTMSVPRGGKVCLRLQDSSLVWINENSQLTYGSMRGTKREVELRGEAYFEIKSQHDNPFFVRGEQQTIQVVGTKFNAKFKTKNETALLEGKVLLSNHGSSLKNQTEDPFNITMKPGQVYNGEKLFMTKHIEQYISWKDGIFNLDGLSMLEFASQLSEWYAVPITVAPDIAKAQLFGQVSRSKDLKQVLEVVERAVPFKYNMQNGKLMVVKK